MQHLALDYEYIESKDKTYHSVICCVIMDIISKQIWRFDLRWPTSHFIDFFNLLNLDYCVFYGWNITTAEIPVTIQLLSLDFVKKMKWVDLWVEFKMIALTHPKYFTKKLGLDGCISTLKLEAEYKADKKNTINLILFSDVQRDIGDKLKKNRLETNEFFYTDDEFSQILEYCEEDVKILPKIMDKLKPIHLKYGIKTSHIEKRSEHSKLAGISHYMSRGYPMDVHKVKTVFENVAKIKVRIAKDCNEKTQFEIYEAQYKGPTRQKIFTYYSFNMENFTNYIISKGLFEIWEKTEKSKALKLEEDYLDEMLSNYKEILEPVYFARNTIKQLNSTNLAEILTDDGFIKSVSFPFHQKTSRTSPKPSMGFILNLTPWLRMLIHPPKGYAFVGIDFKSQEVLIAALLSRDFSMLEDYLTDIYMGQAIKTGFAPAGATKKTHPELREGFKPISLGVSYLMGENTLSVRFKNLYELIGVKKSDEECKRCARLFLLKYNQVYYKYNHFIKNHFQKCRTLGYFKTIDYWYYFLDSNTKDTQLQNVPCQSTGAAMTREAHDRCALEGIYTITLHDALYFYCKKEEAISLAKIVSKNMCDASKDLLGEDYMQTETIIYTHDQPYYDKRGVNIYRTIMEELNLPCPVSFNKPNEIVNIHKI
jgi:DNA polymerase-1